MVLPRKIYDDARTGKFQKVLEYLVEDMRSLFYDGITSRDGTTYFFAVIHVMGDWPFLAKAFNFTRTCQNAAKAPSAKNPACEKGPGRDAGRKGTVWV